MGPRRTTSARHLCAQIIYKFNIILYFSHSTAAIDAIMAKKELRAEELSSLTSDDVDDKTDPERKQEERIVSWCHRYQYNILSGHNKLLFST